jgi:hypothetical protein
MLLRRILGLAGLLIAATSAIASAQIITGPTLYRLDAATDLQEGCQPPCLCPIVYTDDVFGTLVLTFNVADPQGFVHYTVDRVNWVVGTVGHERRVTGSGEYKVGGQFAIRHELMLDLSIDGAAPIHFDSGLVLGGGSFPALDISIAQNGFYCYDTVFHVVASQVPATAITPYTLGRTLYEEGCFAPCTCPLFRRRTVGTFGLLDLGPTSDPAQHHFALVDIAWHTRPPPVPPTQTFTGLGIYSVDVNTLQHRLVCDLTDANGLTQRFDSALIAGGATFPRIDIPISVHAFVCYDQVFLMHAIP